ncbi:hypothetical protein HT585_24420 [Ensifer sp. HO-A22]|uniref:Uncharacterized protein n=1 Tax=Ensifer oleiphilus TaxID=2742698 RepID=A0A7Y6UQ28_9HYPH|nr:hypothetical protein [Ensifer oleiphilus]
MALPEFGLHLSLKCHDLSAHLFVGATERKQLVGKLPAFAPPIFYGIVTMEIFEVGSADANGAQSSCHRKRNDLAPAKHHCFI